MNNYSDGATASRYYLGHEAGGGGQAPDAHLSSGETGGEQGPDGPRARLIRAMGLAYDPFTSGVSEKDLAPDFGSIYVAVRPGLLDKLRKPEAGCVFADYGMGKTATRIAVEYALRLARTPCALSVTYTPSIDSLAADEGRLLDTHLEAIALELRVDLIIQYIERLPERYAERDTPVGPLVQRALYRQARSLPTRFLQAMRRAHRAPQSEGAFWRQFRPAVRYTPVTPAWRALVETLVRAAQPGGIAALWEESVFDAWSLGFSQVFVLIDAVDNQGFGAEEYLELLRPLLLVAGELERHGIYLKFFLPRDLKTMLDSESDSHRYGLTLPQTIATIDEISEVDLDKILTDRLEAARTSDASFRSLDWLGQDLNESVQVRLVNLAAGSPRRLIELANALIDFHSLNGFRQEERLWLTLAEWQRFLDNVERPIPAPA